MAVHVLVLLCALSAILCAPAPAPGRVPRVYNALITSNQNLEPSKAYPVYQPVLHDTFYPYQPFFYGDIPLTNNLLPPPVSAPKAPEAAQSAPPPAEAPKEGPAAEAPAEAPPLSAEGPPVPAEPASTEATPATASPQPPRTESPIPVNQFGLPPQVFPLGRIDPAYNGFTQIGPYPYAYPNFRFYDPYDPFSFNPYLNLSPPQLYRPLPNFISQGPGPQDAVAPGKDSDVPSASVAEPTPLGEAAPPPEPADLTVLNYTSKDPAIPNVPPPPLPEGGLKTDKSK